MGAVFDRELPGGDDQGPGLGEAPLLDGDLDLETDHGCDERPRCDDVAPVGNALTPMGFNPGAASFSKPGAFAGVASHHRTYCVASVLPVGVNRKPIHFALRLQNGISRPRNTNQPARPILIARCLGFR